MPIRCKAVLVSFTHLIVNKTKQKGKTRSQIVGMFVILQTFFTAFNLYKSNKYRGGFDQIHFYCLQAVTFRSRRMRYVDGSTLNYLTLWDFFSLNLKGMFRIERDTS